MKTLILYIVVFLGGAMCQSCQSKTSDAVKNVRTSKPPYEIGVYQIDPDKKIVKIQRYWESDKNGTHSWGNEWVADKSINYDNTSLIIIGGRIFFKEYFKDFFGHVKQPFDFSTFKIISTFPDEEFFKDKNTIYDNTNAYDISEYKPINDWVYQDKSGDLYFMESRLNRSLYKVVGLKNLDLKTLEHVIGNYFMDKNGLYFFAEQAFLSEASKKVDNSDGKQIKPVITRNYFIYNEHVYSTKRDSRPTRLNIKANKLIETEWEPDVDYTMTDGKNLYENHRYGYDDSSPNKDQSLNDLNGFIKRGVDFKSGVDISQIYSPSIVFLIDKNNNEAYFPIKGPKRPSISNESDYNVEHNSILVRVNRDYYYLDNQPSSDKSIKIKKVWFFNVDTKKDEEFDPSLFKYIDWEIYAYKDHLFYKNYPVKEKMNIKDLRCVTSKHGFKSNYITDGKLLVYVSTGGYALDGPSEYANITFKDSIIKGADISKLKVINKDTLVDDNYIFYQTTAIPIKKLGIDVKIFVGE